MKFTTILDMIGLFLLVIASAVSVAIWYWPAGFAVVGLGILGISWLVDRKAGKG